jgi:hypothetical protein
MIPHVSAHLTKLADEEAFKGAAKNFQDIFGTGAHRGAHYDCMQGSNTRGI